MRLDIRDILFEELERTRLEIISSMKTNNQYVTGKTAASLHTEATNDSGILYGADYFDTLETGISPFQSRINPFKTTFYALRQWYQDKGINRMDVKTDGRIFKATVNQREIGSVLFRKGGRTDVFTDKANPLTQRIGKRVTDKIINIKILP